MANPEQVLERPVNSLTLLEARHYKSQITNARDVNNVIYHIFCC